jgi:hypothetical protein
LSKDRESAIYHCNERDISISLQFLDCCICLPCLQARMTARDQLRAMLHQLMGSDNGMSNSRVLRMFFISRQKKGFHSFGNMTIYLCICLLQQQYPISLLLRHRESIFIHCDYLPYPTWDDLVSVIYFSFLFVYR